MTPLLTLEGVAAGYGDGSVITGVDLQIDRGDFVGIVGPSGSGKSTLLRVLLGSVAVSEGRLDRTGGTRLGYVPQVEQIDWDFPVTVAQCVLMSRTRGRILPWASKAEKADVARVLDRLGIGDLAGRHIRALSGGQQQRVFLARAMLAEPDLLLLDEPTSGVDVRTRHEILHLLGELHDGGLGIVLTTHDLNGIAAHLPRLVCLNKQVIGAGAPHEVLVPSVLEATYGSPMEVLEHGGMRVVVDVPSEAQVIQLRDRSA
ncbi:MAG TPA: metal ABC transporter ATP-binding protein [Acidimicrobiales bacterium]|nr:metal ABC transporter ATP-binding protein [Acidimicrobiales bacterium]